MTNRRNYQNLVVWQRAMNLVLGIYQITRELPDFEKYGLVSQLQRAAVSVPSNIAEGAGRDSAKEFLRFIAIARGSLFEVETQLILAEKIGYISDTTKIKSDIDAIFAMLTQLGRHLRQT